ncbi:VOC family protein [Acrocarpospora macrocephala]|uniref:Biphenyl-2,3-diol 1,2-dioxygenase n=1 Tax=Acrocarpospora macrocephala TaxID=150177 RepID=A0A5M3WS90_9ACTN|nr:VOC family protein [Acrocarpospora macrocephala]GES09593.1 biphenyl-2,3-diol 1,2-dioxygenase [Acrocarpospora macrocephala]
MIERDLDLVDGFGYLSLAVHDLDAAVWFYRQVIRLEVVEERPGVVYLTGDQNHHWLRLKQSDQSRLLRVGYRATSAAALDIVRERLTAAGVAYHDRVGTDDDQVTGGLHFRDPAGLEIDLYEEMQQLPASAAEPDVGFTCNLHAVLSVPDVVANAAFYRETLGFRRSDQLLDLVIFLRSGNRYHHSLAFSKGEPGLDHFCVLVRSVDELMRLRTHLQRTGALGDDLVKHAASGSISVYAHDPVSDSGVEFCTGHAVIGDDSYNGRMLKPGPTTVNLWAKPFPQRGEAPALTTKGGPGSRAAALAVQS